MVGVVFLFHSVKHKIFSVFFYVAESRVKHKCLSFFTLGKFYYILYEEYIVFTKLYTDPFVMVGVVFLFHPVKHKIFSVFFDVAESRVKHKRLSFYTNG